MVEREELEKVLNVIQTLDPAEWVQQLCKECLLIQIRRKQEQISDEIRLTSMILASNILEDHYDAFTKKHYSQILEKFEIDEDVLKLALDEITKLNPKPGNSEAIQTSQFST